MRKNKLNGITREELESHILDYLNNGGKIKQIPSFEPTKKSEVFQEGELNALDRDDPYGINDIGIH